MTSFPVDGAKRQRWQAFVNKGNAVIPGYAIMGPVFGDKPNDDVVDAIEGADNREPALRLGRANTAFIGGQDAALFYVNGAQQVAKGGYGSCTQDGPMQCLVGYPKESPPTWNEYLAIDLYDTYNRDTPYALTPGNGGYRFISFNNCPETSYKDKNRPTYEYKVAWVAPAYKDNVPVGYVFRMGSGSATVEAHSVVSFGSALGPQAESFGPSARIAYDTTEESTNRLAGFFRLPSQGQYLLNFTATIRSLDAPISGAYTIGLTARTGRYDTGPGDTLTRAAIEENIETINGGSTYPDFNGRHQLLAATTGIQAADTNLYHTEVDGYITERERQEVARHWMTVGGSTVLDVYAGDYLFFFNPTDYEITIENFSGTLTLLPGVPSFSTRSNVTGT